MARAVPNFEQAEKERAKLVAQARACLTDARICVRRAQDLIGQAQRLPQPQVPAVQIVAYDDGEGPQA